MNKFELRLKIETEMEKQEFEYHLRGLREMGELHMKKTRGEEVPHFDWDLKVLNLDEKHKD